MAEIIQLAPPTTPGDDAPVRRRPRPHGRYCRHLRTELDETARRVHCRDCGQEVDAFDFLTTLAHEFERWESARDQAETDARRALKELEDVKRQVRNAKAQLRRATRG